MEKDRSRRYETANQIAADIQHYLQNEPVQACPPSASYRLKKFAGRHSALVSYLAGLTFALIMAVVFIVSLVHQRAAKEAALEVAKRNERLARTEVAKVNAVVDLLQQMLAAAHPDAARGSQFTVRQMLDEFSTRFSIANEI